MTTLEETGFEYHEMPAGQHVYYHEERHAYYRDIEQDKYGIWKGKGRLTGCSTVAAPYDFRPDGLMKWAAKLTREGIATIAAQSAPSVDSDSVWAYSWLESEASIEDALAGAHLRYFDVLRSARCVSPSFSER